MNASASFQNPGSVDIRRAEGPLDRDAVFQLRHRVFGAHGDLHAPGLQHSNGRLLEESDCNAEFFGAFDIRGVAMAAISRQPLNAVLNSSHRCSVLKNVAVQYGGQIDRMTYTSRFIIDPESGANNLALRVFAAMLKAGVKEQITHDFCACDERRLLGRNRLGYREINVRMLDEHGNPNQLLVLPLATQDAEVRPLTRLLRRVVRAA